MYKLLKMGVDGSFLKVLENMDNNVYYCVKIDGVTPNVIPSKVGVKQGCVLSPLLFNLFLSDMPNIFNDICDPIHITDNTINCLMYADDLVLISQSANGLQNCLNALQSYCNKWCLTVNTKKTKVIIFNQGGYKIKRFSFTFNNTVVEIVQQYTYLGILFTASGSFKPACLDLQNKAKKAFF